MIEGMKLVLDERQQETLDMVFGKFTDQGGSTRRLADHASISSLRSRGAWREDDGEEARRP